MCVCVCVMTYDDNSCGNGIVSIYTTIEEDFHSWQIGCLLAQTTVFFFIHFQPHN